MSEENKGNPEGNNPLAVKVARLEEGMSWVKDDISNIKANISDLSAKLDSKVSLKEFRVWMTIVTLILLILTILLGTVKLI